MSNDLELEVKETQQETQEEPLDEYEQSAAMFHAYSKQFRKLAYELAESKKKGPARVLEALIFEPLEEVKLFGQREQTLLQIAQNLLYHKNKITEYALKRHEENQKEKSNVGKEE